MISIKRILKIIGKALKNALFILCVRHAPKQIKKDSIIIIKTDSIGDYLLFRNFIPEIRLAYPKYSITLLGNIAWKTLSKSLDSNYIDEFIWIDKGRFPKKYLHTIIKLHKIQYSCYDILINPLHSRDETSELIAKYIFANSKYTSQGDCINLQSDAKQKADLIYTKLFPSSKSILFEFYRNQEFFENFLNKKLSIKLCIESKIKTQNHHIKKTIEQGEYATLFIGANAIYRKWSMDHFAKVACYLARHNMNIIICGGKEDLENSNLLVSIISKSIKDMPLGNDSKQPNKTNLNITNLVGQTTLNELAQIVQNASMLISNETGCAHLGAIIGIPTFVISNGNHLGRFTPYPKALQKIYYAIYPKSIMQAINNEKAYMDLCQSFAFRSNLAINEINADCVISTIESFLCNLKTSKQAILN
ncbi:lipopolysaccharide heptosyltransferase family protein [Helicobacter muridarum]|uniref:ADP-heptose:LPS heptosyltransferase n=1 Tax=Helicobacter muridarum TaxID=216 RepID=A0A377PWQ8_9HELI|nr:glycosyltransferase family 9 protein [Helicobacter muridarum]TLE00003.1 lipopolysaccharide heptosyltransferase family protein [Helicobacter muridarum]STQ87075.1 ADP-heptose:LPS heptosyltransferase [Helicobacter muridarum]